MKVIYLVSTLKSAGPTSQLYYIIRNLPEKITPIIITLSPETNRSREADFRKLGVLIYKLNLSRISGMFKAKASVRNIIDKERPDVIHSQGFRGDVLASYFSHRIPIICTVRNYPQLDFPMTYGRIIGNMMCFRQVRALRKATRVCAVSDAVKDNLIDSFNLKNVMTILNGVDTVKFSSVTATNKKYLRQKLNIDEKARVWISSLGKDDRKNSLVVAKAFKLLSEVSSSDVLIFIGDGKQRVECEAILKDNANSKFFGKVDNVFEFLQASDFFISASLAEGMPNAVLEAMACGLPTVLSNIPPHNEIKFKNPNGCLLFDAYNSVELYNKLKEISEKQYESLSQDVNSTVIKFFSSSVMAANYESIYQNL